MPNHTRKATTCSVEGCTAGGYITRGLCKMHYARLRRHGDPGEAAKQHSVSWAGVTCQVDECDSPVRAVGYCLAHYKRFRRYGDPNGSRPTTPASVRFWEKVRKVDGGCWEWTAGQQGMGYGMFHPTHGRTFLPIASASRPTSARSPKVWSSTTCAVTVCASIRTISSP